MVHTCEGAGVYMWLLWYLYMTVVQMNIGGNSQGMATPLLANGGVTPVASTSPQAHSVSCANKIKVWQND